LEPSGRFVEKNRELFELCLSLRTAALEPPVGALTVTAQDEKKLRRELTWRRSLEAFGAKADRTFCAIIELCAKGYTEDATILMRSLLDLDVSLRYVELDPQPRIVEMMYEADREYLKELEEMTKIRTLDIELEKALNDTRARLAQLEHDLQIDPKKWHKKTMREKTEGAGLEDQYFVFCRFSGLLHANPNKLMSYIRSQETTNEVFAVDSRPHGANLRLVLASAASYFADILLLRRKANGLDTAAFVRAHESLKEHYLRTKKNREKQTRKHK